MLKERLAGEVEAVDLKRTPNPDIAGYDAVVLGGSIHAGSMQAKVTKFAAANHATLAAKRLGLYLCCMFEGEKATAQFEAAYPADLRAAAVATGVFGGAFEFAKMGFFERVIVKQVSGISQDTCTLSEAAIDAFAEAMHSATA
jgi:menaquinone-dependent protoporphyrinogen oxidase